LSSDALRNPGKDDINEVIMSDNVKSGSNKLRDYASSPIDEYERACQQIMDDAALDLSDVQVNEVIQFALELLRERTELLENALETCRKTPKQHPSYETLESWIERFYAKCHNRLRSLRDDGIEFEDESVKEAFDVGFKILNLYSEYENRILLHIIDTAQAKTR
jgi:hypothetical protein